MRCYVLGLLVVCGVLLCANRADAVTITVCPTGCTQTLLQTAIDAAIAGDTILLNTTGTFSGTFILRHFTCAPQDDTCYITIKSGVTSTGTIVAASTYPAANIRIPRTQASLATIMPTANNATAFRTVLVTETGSGCSSTPCVADHWNLQFLNIVANPNLAVSNGGAELLHFGTMNTGADAQDTKAKEPHHINLNQCLVHGNALTGQLRGLLLAARDSNVTNNVFFDIKSQNEGQSLWIENNTGPNLVTNNEFEGGAEVVMSGGAIAQMKLNSTVAASPAPTTTTMTLADPIPDWAYIGQGFSYFVGGVMKYSHITGLPGGSALQMEANGTPDVAGLVNLQLVQRNLTFTKNWVHRPVSWRDPIVSTPQSVSATASNTGGTLVTGTYSYRVVALITTNMAQVARSTASTEIAVSITDAAVTTGSVAISWAAVPNAGSYKVYGRSAGGENVRFTVTAPTTTFTDTGAAGTTEAVPTTTGTVWQVKNLLELKKYDTALIEGNVFEYCWLQAQNGEAILFQIANNSTGLNGGDSVAIRNITFRNNIVRHASNFMTMTFHDASGDISDYLRDITVYNNLGTDLNSVFWSGNSGRNTILITGSLGTFTSAYLAGQDGPARIKFDHNTILDDSSVESFLFDTYKGSPAAMRLCTDCVFTNNILRHGNYGLRAFNPTLTAEGNAAWSVATTGVSTWSTNVLPVTSCSLYPLAPASTFCPNEATFQSAFANFVGGDYTVTALWVNAGLDGKNIGADLTTITPLTTIALGGDNSGTPPPTPPTLLTSTLPLGQVGTAYSSLLTASGGTLPYVWTLDAGSTLPAGLTLSTLGLVSGTPTTPGGATFTVRVTGANAAAASQVLSITINDALIPPDRPARIGGVEVDIFRRDTCPTDTIDLRGEAAGVGPKVRVGDLCFELGTSLLQLVLSTAPTVTLEAVGSNASKLTSGTVPLGRLGLSGTPGTTTFLRGDNTWQVPAASTVPFANILIIAATPGGSQSWNGATTGVTAAGSTSNRIFAQFDLTGYTQCRVWSRVNAAGTGASADVMYAQYSTDNAATWSDLWGTSPNIDLMTISTGNGPVITAFTSIASGAKADVLLRLVASITGTLTGQPSVSNTGLNCK